MCINSDRYLALRACATDRSKNNRLNELIDTDPQFDVETPTDEMFDKIGDLAIRINIEAALDVADAADAAKRDD